MKDFNLKYQNYLTFFSKKEKEKEFNPVKISTLVKHPKSINFFTDLVTYFLKIYDIYTKSYRKVNQIVNMKKKIPSVFVLFKIPRRIRNFQENLSCCCSL